MSEDTTQPPKRLKHYIPDGQQYVDYIKRHPIGLVYIYLIITAAAVAGVIVAASTAQNLIDNLSASLFSTTSLVTLLCIAFVSLVLTIVTGIYFQNTIIITDKETIQILQGGAFQVKVSHLSHADIEDVTSEQNGLFQTIFNYGTLHIETSGELKNFAFKYCPDPEGKARIVLRERQKFVNNN